MSDEEKKNMEILIRRGDTVSYDSDKLYRNNIEIPKIDEDKRCTKDRAEAEKQVFYDTFFRQPFKHIIILAAAGTSLDNGSVCGRVVVMSSNSYIRNFYPATINSEKLQTIKILRLFFPTSY